MAIPAHPYAKLFPMLGQADADALRDDIAANGLFERIVILGSEILDGRNRQQAGFAAGVLPDELPPEGDDLWVSHYRRFNPAQDGDPLKWVLSKNLRRRHLTERQRAMVAADLATMRQGERTDRDADSDEPSANLPKVSQSDAAEMLQVSTRSVTAAAKVREQGAPELVERVASGDVSVSAASDIADLPVEDQLVILESRDPKAFRRAVRDLRTNRQSDGRAVMNSRVQPPDDLDYSPTPPWATRAFLQIVLPHLGQSLAGMTVLEPACGEGHISAVLMEAEPLVVWASDIWDYSVDGVSPPGWVGQRDYLADSEPSDGVDWVVMNPPFREKAEQFFHKAFAEAQVGVAMFVRLGWLASKGRFARIFSVTPPTVVAIFAEDVPLHMGRWEPDGATLSDYVWLVWVKGAAPMPTFWIPPGQREALTLTDDVERFTAHPVRSRPILAAETHAASEAIAISKAEAIEIIKAEYTGANGQELADRLGRPLNTIRKWAWEAGVSDRSRLPGNFSKVKREKEAS